MKLNKNAIIIFFTILNISFFSPTCFASEVRIENVHADKTSSKETWGVKGKVRNLENHPIKGYVKIKYIDAQGDILQSVNAWVNDGDLVEPGQAAAFEYWDSRKNLEDAVRFQVIFKDR